MDLYFVMWQVLMPNAVSFQFKIGFFIQIKMHAKCHNVLWYQVGADPWNIWEIILCDCLLYFQFTALELV